MVFFCITLIELNLWGVSSSLLALAVGVMLKALNDEKTGFDLQPGSLDARLAGLCQPNKKNHSFVCETVPVGILLLQDMNNELQ
eukprot:1156458-Pelagomonas_calceolata.AAC.1